MEVFHKIKVYYIKNSGGGNLVLPTQIYFFSLIMNLPNKFLKARI